MNLLRALGRLSLGQQTLAHHASKLPSVSASSAMISPSIDFANQSRSFSKIVSNIDFFPSSAPSTTLGSTSALLAPTSRLNPGSILSVLGTTPTIRGKRKAFQSTCRNKRRNRKPHKRRQYGWYKNEGMYVMENHVLVNQRALNVYPGENVGVHADKSLYALRAGMGIGRDGTSPSGQ